MTIHIFNSLLTMTTALRLTTNLNSIPKNNILNTLILSDNFVVKHKYYNIMFKNNIEYHNLKCWKSMCIFNFNLEYEKEENLIFSLDFNINKNDLNNQFIKIENIIIDNDFYDTKYNEIYKKLNFYLNDNETKLIGKSLIIFIENYAIKNKINKIIIDIHSNLERFNYDLKDLGFNPTERRCLLNPFWIEAEKII
jgi:hypothetical protein